MLETRLFSNQSIILPSFSSHKSIVKSDKFCKKLNLCQEVTALTSEFHLGNCEAWRETVTKLKDPETKRYFKLQRTLDKGFQDEEVFSCKEDLKTIQRYGD
ncbi:cyclin B1 [Arabidopsis thaliana]|uniref:Cyclin B1 n=1 Tax=Arabidopsis thaliana TaxID=3702 RepID=A0A1I9LSE2_ARATH|nr:cyclin B1 [Arabidopsis thaliana]ANM65500.1 cyclin B1 [Arabidopsis thaliana]|eukprot:NP_001327462.1 cyclin B1 [Arabidopsis thaliana]